MARYRNQSGVVVEAIKNEGDWPKILAFLDETGLSAIPMFGHPPLTREQDGTLIIWDINTPVPVGDWLFMTLPMRQLYAFTDSDFHGTFELIEKDEK
jgi:hypothetical protein